MKISELINKLQEIQKSNGDISVVNYNFEDCILYIYPKDDFYDTMLIIQ